MPQESPADKAKEIVDILTDVPFSTADASLKIARVLLDYRATIAGDVVGELRPSVELAELVEQS